MAHASPHQRPAFGAWCLRAYSVDPKHVPGLRARPPLVRSSSHAGNTSSNLVGVTTLPGFGRIFLCNRSPRIEGCRQRRRDARFDDASSGHPLDASEKLAHGGRGGSSRIAAHGVAKPWRFARCRWRPPPHDKTTKSPNARLISGSVCRIFLERAGISPTHVCRQARLTWARRPASSMRSAVLASNL